MAKQALKTNPDETIDDDRVRATITRAADALCSHQRLLTERPPPPRTFSESLAIAGAIGERYGFATAWSGPADDRIVASELTDAQIDHGVALRAAGLGTADTKVAANMWFQWYCYRMAAPLLATWVLHRRVPDVSAGNIAFRFDAEGRPAFTQLIEMKAAALPGDEVDDIRLSPTIDLLAEIVRVLLDGHLLPLAERVRVGYRLGVPITKGTIASQIGMAFTALDSQTPLQWEHVAADAVALMALTKPLIEGQGRSGDVICCETAERTGMTFRRGTCCLVYKADGRDKCGGCPLHSDDHRAGVWADRLAARPATYFT